MSLDITISRAKEIRCPCCGCFIMHQVQDTECSGGRVWYDILEKIGYYVPYEKRTAENDWYGKDMILTDEQAKELYEYAKTHYAYNSDAVANIVANAICSGEKVVINADW